MNDIKCPNLVEWLEWVILMCKKGDRPYVPSASELRSYCKSKSYDKCPHNARFEHASNVKIIYTDVNNNEICHK